MISDENAPRPGTVLARKYKVERTLGAGGMGVVVAATHIQLHEPVAIKLLHAEVASRSGAIERFLREARVAMKLRGEHVVRIHDVGTLDDGAPFIVMEYLKGSDLGRMLLEKGRFEVADAAELVLQACEAIAEAHAIGVVHRDLKPANLFLTTSVDGSPSIKVLDFGVSKVLSDLTPSGDVLGMTAPPSEPPATPGTALGFADTHQAVETSVQVTRTQAIVGSPRYMAPEQIRSARDVDARADLWSLGIILYELVTGERPFDAETLDRLKKAILDDPPRPPTMPLPRGIDKVVDTCLAKAREDRYPDVLALAEALAPFGGEEARASVERTRRILTGGRRSGSMRAPTPTEPVQAVAAGGTTDRGVMRETEKKPSAPSGRRNVVWGGAAIAFVAVAIAGATWDRRDAKAPEPAAVASPLSAPAPAAPPSASVAPEPPPPAASSVASARKVDVPAAPRPRPRPAASASGSVDPLGIDGGALFNDPH
jgi:serine/threonine-protein kinase